MNFNNVLHNEKIEFGKVTDVLKEFSLTDNVLFVTSNSFSERGIVTSCQASLAQCDFFLFDHVAPNPQVSQIRELVNRYAQCQIKTIIALGGGSALDTAKVLSLWLGEPHKRFEQLLSTDTNHERKIPVIAVPTTAGTGAEVTPFATVWDKEKQKKYSVLDVKPTRVILDADLTLSLPRQETLYSALDALSHSLESIWNINCSEDSKKYAESAIALICEGLPLVMSQPDDIGARRQLQIAASLAGLAISTTKTAVAHAISYPLTLQHGIPHGLACSVTLKAIIELYGYEKLNLTAHLADNVKKLLASLRLEKEIERFVDWEKLLLEFDCDLDPARAGNFVFALDDKKIYRLLSESQYSEVR